MFRNATASPETTYRDYWWNTRGSNCTCGLNAQRRDCTRWLDTQSRYGACRLNTKSGYCARWLETQCSDRASGLHAGVCDAGSN
jgi:hypothetical protein